MEGGFSPREANPIDPISQRTKPTENIFQRKRRITLRMENKGMVVAVGAAEITVGEEKHGADFSWPIRKGGL